MTRSLKKQEIENMDTPVDSSFERVANWRFGDRRPKIALCLGKWHERITLPETILAPKNGSFQFPIGIFFFRGLLNSGYVSFREGNLH